MSNDIEVTVIKEGSAPKVNPHAIGELNYDLGKDSDNQIYLRITKNSSGGYFSKEWLGINAIKDTLKDYIGTDKAFSSSAFKPLFKNSSANNSGFLAAALRQEGILVSNKENSFHHKMGVDLETWLKNILSTASKGDKKSKSRAKPN